MFEEMTVARCIILMRQCKDIFEDDCHTMGSTSENITVVHCKTGRT